MFVNTMTAMLGLHSVGSDIQIADDKCALWCPTPDAAKMIIRTLLHNGYVVDKTHWQNFSQDELCFTFDVNGNCIARSLLELLSQGYTIRNVYCVKQQERQKIISELAKRRN